MAKNPVPYRRSVVQRVCELISESDQSLVGILRDNPDLPNIRTLLQWREKYPVFARAWKRAREAQAEYLMQHCFDLARSADKSNAHAVRVKFDIYRFNAAHVLPTVYGDKPSESTVNVSTQIVITPERLNAIRGNLERARAQLKEREQYKTLKREREALYPQSLLEYDKNKVSNGEHSKSTQVEDMGDQGDSEQTQRTRTTHAKDSGG